MFIQIRFKWLLRLIFLSIIALPLPAFANLEPTVVEKNLSNMETVIRDMMKQSQIPGLSVAVFSNGQIVYAKGFGVKNLAMGGPVDPETIFEAASICKPMTAFVAMKLVEKKQLNLDQSLAEYLKIPYLNDPKIAAQITLRMVLNHTSGLPNDPWGIDRKVYFTPGDHFSYSGGGFRYLQTVLEAVSKVPFHEYMERELLKPLAMSRSSFVFRNDFAGDMAYGHQNGNVLPLRSTPANAAGSLLSTPTDLARFGMELCNPTLLPAQAVDGMLTPAVRIDEVYSWGLGIGLCRTSAGDIAWQWGDNGIYQNLIMILPKKHSGVVIMTNSSNGLQIAPLVALQLLNCWIENPIDPSELKPFSF